MFFDEIVKRSPKCHKSGFAGQLWVGPSFSGKSMILTGKATYRETGAESDTAIGH